MNAIPKKLEFKYKKAENHRYYHVDGLSGSVTQGQNVILDLFVERPVLPESSVHDISSDGVLRNEKTLPTGIEGDKLILLRIIETSLVMNLSTARSIRDWLSSTIAHAEKLIEEQKQIK